MKLTEPEMRMAYQLESTSQAGVLNELYMTCRYSRDEDTKATAESLMAKIRPLSDKECMALVNDVQKNYHLPGKARTIGEMLAEARQKSGAEKLAGHDIMALERFAPDTRHMIVLDVLSHESPIYRIGPLLGLWFQSMVVGLTMNILSICIFLVVYGRMIEIYLVTSVGPIPFATMSNREWSGVGQNYLKSLIALGFQAFLIMICVGIYAVLIQEISTADNISAAIWGCMGYTVLLCFTLFKTGSMAKGIFSAH